MIGLCLLAITGSLGMLPQTAFALPKPAITPHISDQIAVVPAKYDLCKTVSISIDGQEVRLCISDGADTWVNSTLLQDRTLGNVEGITYQYFDPSVSKHWSPLSNETWRAEGYSNNVYTGVVGTNSFTLGPVSISDVPMVAVSAIQGAVVGNDFADGVIGFGFQKSSLDQPDKLPSFAETVTSSLSKPIIAWDKGDESSTTIQLGAVDTGRYQGDFVKFPTDNSDGGWISTVNASVAVDGEVVAVTGKEGGQLRFSISSGFSMVPGKAFEAIYSSIPRSYYDEDYGTYSFPCNYSDSVKDLTFVVQESPNLSRSFTIPAFGAVYPATEFESLCTGTFYNSSVLAELVPSLHADSDTVLLSMNHVFDQYVVFDYSEPSISFAKSIN